MPTASQARRVNSTCCITQGGSRPRSQKITACDNADMNKPVLHTAVPIYDAVIFCDLGLEPPWVMQQVEFTRRASFGTQAVPSGRT